MSLLFYVLTWRERLFYEHVIKFKLWFEPTVFMNVSGPIMNAPFMCLCQNVLCCSLACNLLVFKVSCSAAFEVLERRKKKVIAEKERELFCSISIFFFLSVVRGSSGHFVPGIDWSLCLCHTKSCMKRWIKWNPLLARWNPLSRYTPQYTHLHTYMCFTHTRCTHKTLKSHRHIHICIRVSVLLVCKVLMVLVKCTVLAEFALQLWTSDLWWVG